MVLFVDDIELEKSKREFLKIGVEGRQVVVEVGLSWVWKDFNTSFLVEAAGGRFGLLDFSAFWHYIT